MGKRKSTWRIWAKALGAKEGKNDREADTVAIIRTVILVSYMVTNVAIVANAVRHWNANDTCVNSSSSLGHTTQLGSDVQGTSPHR
tara:strand:+ start:106 stop:363 length:258 start_codon:yes stop_codon:yes gene_type:complete